MAITLNQQAQPQTLDINGSDQIQTLAVESGERVQSVGVSQVDDTQPLSLAQRSESQQMSFSTDVKFMRGEPGVSPTIDAEAVSGGHNLVITDAEGVEVIFVADGVTEEIPISFIESL